MATRDWRWSGRAPAFVRVDLVWFGLLSGPSAGGGSAGPASERAAKCTRLGIAEGDGDVSERGACGIEQLARRFESDFIENLLESDALRPQAPVQSTPMH
jgi:hypothetical protein